MDQATQLDSAREGRAGGLKFAYASGSRPLSGYVVKRGVGRGGFGEVYYAVSDAGKEVALKLIRRNLDVELRGVTHCLNLKHPNLLALYDVRQDDEENTWVVMEYICGESLEEAIARNPTGMPVGDAMQWLRGIAAGVAYLHDHGIVHRDLKPGNIFADEGIVKLGDYGLSKFISCSRRSGQTESVGTVHYMAPEVANGRYGKEIDIYALGIILYEMLTGRVPFEGESIGEVLMKHLTAEPDLSLLQEPFRTVIGRALAKDPEVRLRNVEELMAGLPKVGNSAAGQVPTMQLSSPSPRRSLTAGGHRPGLAEVSPQPGEPVEPIEQAIRQGYSQLKHFWNRPDVNTPAKVAVLIGAVLLLISNAVWMLPLLGALLLVYGGYRLVRAIVLYEKLKGQNPAHARAVVMAELAGAPPRPPATVAAAAMDAPAAASPTAGPAEAPPRTRRQRRQWRRSFEPRLVLKPPRERVTDLLGSLLLASGVALAICLVLVLLVGTAPRLDEYVWLSLTSTLGAWTILIPSKLWEGRRGDPVRRRFTLLVLGLGVGALSWLLAGPQGLMLGDTVHYDRDYFARDKIHFPWDFVQGFGGERSLYASMAHFGFLLLLVRWWRQADPMRSTRLSLWATGWTVLAAWIVNQFWLFPQPWGLMIVATMSIAIQLSSTWVPPQERQYEPLQPPGGTV